MKPLRPGVIEHFLKGTGQKFLCTCVNIYTTKLSYNAGVALGKQVRAV